MKRRSFIGKVAGITAVVAGVLAATGFLKQFYPFISGRKHSIRIGNLHDYPVGTFTLIKDHNLFVYRDHEGVRALSAVCTHLGCILEKGTEGFVCPCHGTTYDDEGKVLSGPAPRNLVWYKVSRSQDGKLVIHMNHPVKPAYKYNIS
ncbi:MAG TPA: ubiquinol-cytochrome c reductase iron-sulfur subunit [Bacteroidaceae bacterium]|nr:ubiquinol-cytochrome c reductase iron-sulfur subunit [Bacteroidaceae bacterium]